MLTSPSYLRVCLSAVDCAEHRPAPENSAANAAAAANVNSEVDTLRRIVGAISWRLVSPSHSRHRR